ncbi:ubiquitin carboxyl-terminal hydrolase 12-like, partial [Trifolium medium]|nr:ubiquitin carboxyl-terminal hydrolase 12-like [Trifolium medium]
INDRYEFPLQLDLDRDNGKYLSPDADRNVRNLYTLHSSCASACFLIFYPLVL